MLTAACVMFVVLISFGVMQAGMALRMLIELRSKSPQPVPVSALPRAGVVLSLRGHDAYLTECLQGLVDQDYPDYTVQVIVDAEDDPAWLEVERVVRESGATHVRVSPLAFRRSTCSLKCSSLIQGVTELDADHEVIAFIDADVIPHRTWLQELVTPLLQPGIGATTGNRWYAPGHRLWGSATRCAWSAAAIVQMYLFDIVWGGSMAIKTSTIRQTRLIERWALSFNDDLLVGHAVRESGLKLKFVPSLVMVNREECAVHSFRNWVTRQLVHTRFYHPHWPAVATFGMIITVMMPLALLFSAGALLLGDMASAAWAGGGLVGYLGIMIGLYFGMEWGVRGVVRKRGEPFERMTFSSLWAVPLAHGMYGAATVSAMFQRTVHWRGVTYRIHGPWKVEMLDYRPFKAAIGAQEARVSI